VEERLPFYGFQPVQAPVGPRGGRGDLVAYPGKEISCAVIVETILSMLEARDNRMAGARVVL